MTNEDLNKFIKKIEEECSESEAYFDWEFNEDFGIAKGNKSGLLLYTKEFLKAVKDIEKRKFEEEDMEIYNPDFKWIDGVDSNPFSYIKITKKLRHEIEDKKKPEKENWKNKLFGIGCTIILISIVFLTIVGFVTLWKCLI